MTLTLADAREARLDRELDAMIAAKLSGVQLAAPVGPHAKVKLRNLLKYYAKKPHPFTACVRDNMKRFGPGRTEAVCATLKDVIRGRKDWRGKDNPKDHGVAPGLSEEPPLLDSDVLLALDAMSEIDLQEIFLEARALEEHGTVEGVALLNVDGRSELERWGSGQALELAVLDAKKRSNLKPEDFALPPDGYPMHDLAHARNALARAAQHATPAQQATIKARVYRRWPQLKPSGGN